MIIITIVIVTLVIATIVIAAIIVGRRYNAVYEDATNSIPGETTTAASTLSRIRS